MRKIMFVVLSLILLSSIFVSNCITQTAGLENNAVGESSSVDWWPMFHRDLRRTGYSTSKAPNTNYTLWNRRGMTGSPVVVDGIIFVASGEWLNAINATNGELIWNHSTQIDTIHFFFYSAPAVADGTVFIGATNGIFYALDESTGASIWNYSIGNPLISHFFYSSPAVAEGMVFVGADQPYRVYALNQTNGAVIWTYTTGDGVNSSPAVADGMVFVGSLDGKVYALNQTDGTQIWNRTIGEFFSSPAVADGKVFIGSQDHKVYALNQTNGAVIWNYTTGGEIYYSSPAVAEGMVFIGSIDGKVYALDELTGTSIWNYTTGGRIDSSPAVADGKVFIGSQDHKVYALNQTNGAVIWNYTTDGTVVIVSSPAVADGKVFIGVDSGRFYVLGGNYTHDVAVTSVTLSRTAVEPGEIVYIYVNVQNEGTEAETFNVNATYDSNLIETQTVTLAPGQAQNITFTWNTSGVAFGTYTIKAEANILPGEINIEDNTYIDGTIFVRIVDIAVTSVTPSTNNVIHGQVLNITVTIENQGSVTARNFDVTVYANTSKIGEHYVSGSEFLSPGEVRMIDFEWNTTEFATGDYTISANATVLSREIDTADNTYTDDVVTVNPPIRDVAVTSVIASPTSVTQGQTVTITVVVKNEGTLSESFSVTAHYDNTAVGPAQTVTNLTLGASQTLYFYWNTGGVTPDTYTIKAVASTVPEETDTADNTKIDGTVAVTAPTGVGGIVVPIDKLGLLAPYIGVASTIAVATVAAAIYVKRVKHTKEKQ